MPKAYNRASDFRICSYWVAKLMMLVFAVVDKVYASKSGTSISVQIPAIVQNPQPTDCSEPLKMVF